MASLPIAGVARCGAASWKTLPVEALPEAAVGPRAWWELTPSVEWYESLK